VCLGYSSSHLGYHCLDVASQRIYVSRYVRFHENFFSFVNFKQITHTPVPSTQPTYLPPLNSPQLFSLLLHNLAKPTPLSYHLPHPNRPPHLPTDSTITSSPPNLAILSSSACFYNDHYIETCSQSIDVHASKSATAK
jgi:hypothetical protein